MQRVGVIASGLVSLAAVLAAPRTVLAATGAAGPLPPEGLALPAETSMVMGLDVRRVLGSAVYKRLAAATPADGPEQLIDELERKTGISIRRDVDQIVFGLSQGTTGRDLGLALLVGRFDQEALARALAAKTDLTKREHLGAALYLLGSGASEPALTVLDKRVVAVGDTELVKAFLASRAQGAEPLRSNAVLVALLGRVEAEAALWLVGNEAFVTELGLEALAGGPGPPDLAPPKGVAFTALLDPAPILQATAEAADGKAALGLAQRIRGSVATLALKEEPGLKELASAFRVTTEAQHVRVVVRIPDPALDQLFDSLGRRSVSGEAAAIGDVRTVISAQTAYLTQSGGTYGELRCLAEPWSCLPDYSRGRAAFLDGSLVSLADKSGYRRRLYLSRSRDAFAYTAVPSPPGKSGVRGLCGDASGVICVTSDGSEPPVVDGRCPADCQVLP